jgi:hypothetical protein
VATKFWWAVPARLNNNEGRLAGAQRRADAEGELPAEQARCGAVAAETVICAVLAEVARRLSPGKGSKETSSGAP